jgi:protein farnesyltransferase/geranylgeranyltransferase type-1 subunit alpha
MVSGLRLVILSYSIHELMALRLYRSATLVALNSDLNHELTQFLNPLSLAHLKNYQIWHHRQTIIDRLKSYDNEHEFLASMFARDAKNYHVWSYRQWLVRRFGLWDDEREWQAVATLLEEDVRNNSAWNHRWYLAFARPGEPLNNAESVQKEWSFAKENVAKAPQNASPWNYMRGLFSKASGDAKISSEDIAKFAAQYAVIDGSDVKSSHALELLALTFAEDVLPEKRTEAVNALELLAEKYDPIRAPYWRYRIALVNGGRSAVTPVS